jgi:hypothetical protein
LGHPALSPIALASSFVSPLADVRQAFLELDSVCFASLEKLDGISIHGWASPAKITSLYPEVSTDLDFALIQLDSQFC